MAGGLPNITGNFSDDVVVSHETRPERIFLEVFTAVGLVSVTSNILLSFVILKYKKMRRDPTNMIFLQINILQAILLISGPMTIRVAMLMYLGGVHDVVFCVSYQIQSTVAFGLTWFLFLLTCDWLLKLYCKDTYLKFSRIYVFLVIFVYLLVVLACSITAQVCFHHIMMAYTYFVLVASVGLMLLFLIIINIIHLIKKRKILINYRIGNIGLAIANIFFLSWIPLIAWTIMASQGSVTSAVVLIVMFSLGFASPVYNLVYLYFYDDCYNVFLKQVFMCKCNEYKNESFENQSVSYNDADGVKIEN